MTTQTTGGHSMAVHCPRCQHGFRHVTGTLDPEEGRCSHEWRETPARGVAGGITCANCGLFVESWSVPGDAARGYATSFTLGHDGDDDERPFVSVERQYGSRQYPIRPWVVCEVRNANIAQDSKTEFDDQGAALAFGWKRLAEMRRAET